MRIERHRPQRRNRDRRTTGCAVLSVVIAVVMLGVTGIGLLAPELPAIIMQSIGFQAIGETETVFTAIETPEIPVMQVASVPPSIIVSAGTYGSQRFAGTSELYNVQLGMEDSDTASLRATFSEDQMLRLCQRYTSFCNQEGTQIRRTQFDVRPGGAIIQTEIFVQEVGAWQGVRIVLQVVDNQRLEIAGIDQDGTLYNIPSGTLLQLASDVESAINDVIGQMQAQASGSNFRIRYIIADESSVSVIMYEVS